MFKFILLAICFMPTMVNAAVVDSKTETTEVYSGDSLIDNNFDNITDLKAKYNAIENVLAKFQVCEAKNMTYLGEGVAGADSDNCLDIKSIPVKRKSKKPTFQSYVANVQTGNLTDSGTTYNDSDGTKSWGRARADFLCRTNVGIGYRAMTIDDLKYMQKSLNITSGNFAGTTSKRLWLFDATESFAETGLLTKYAHNELITECQGWKSETSGNKALALEITGTMPNYNMSVTSLACDQSALIACVSN